MFFSAYDKPELVEGKDFYFENGRFVLTASYLRKRGRCCANGCRHCPYDPPHVGSQKLAFPIKE